MVVGIGSAPLLRLKLTRNELTHADRVFLWVVNIVVATVFTTDYAVELRLGPRNASFIRSDKTEGVIMPTSLTTSIPPIAVVDGARLIPLSPALRTFAASVPLFGYGLLAAREGRRLACRNTLCASLGGPDRPLGDHYRRGFRW